MQFAQTESGCMKGFLLLSLTAVTAWMNSNMASFFSGIVVGYFLNAHCSQARQLSNYERFRLIVEAAPNAMIKVDGLRRIILMNQQAERMFGYERNELLGHQIEVLIPERYRSPDSAYRTQFFAHPSTRPMSAGRELLVRRKDGSEFPVEIGLNPMDTPHGPSVLGCIVDITARKKEEERFRLVVEAAPNGMILVEEGGKIVLVNQQAERMFGYDRNELINQPVELLIPERYRAAHPVYRGQFFQCPSIRAMGVGRDLYGRRKDGSEFPMEIGLNPMDTSNGRQVLSCVVDITQRKKEEERFRLVVEAAPNGMVLVDESGQMVLVNQQAERMFGYDRNELLQQPVELLLPTRYRAAHPAYRGQFFSCPAIRAMGTGRDLYGRRKDGSEFPVEIGLNPIDTPASRCVLSAIVDITERKRFDKLEAEQLLSRREVLEARARMELLATMSHEIRTPLTSIIGTVELLKDAVVEEETAQRIIDIQRCSNALLSIINNILDWSKLDAGSFKPDRVIFEPRQLLHDVNAILASDIRSKSLAFSINCEEIVPTVVVGDRGRLFQILMNLCCNAVKFTDRGGIVVNMGVQERNSCIRTSSSSSQRALTFEVRDSGQGMTNELLSRLFQPFTQADNSTTRRNSGTGLGLAISKKLITFLGGAIACESEIGGGTTFRFDILVDLSPTSARETPAPVTATASPLSSSSSSSPSSRSLSLSASTTTSPFTGGKRELSASESEQEVCADAHYSQAHRVLLVEDVPIIQRIVRAMLIKLGYATDAVSNGLEAVQACEKDPSSYALILMDCEMPLMDGFTATAQIKRRPAAPPIIAMTANAMMGDRERCLNAGMDGYLAKPLVLADLRRCLNQFLGSRREVPSQKQ